MAIINNISELESLSKTVGGTKADLQTLSIAKEFNEYLRLDSEALLFGLLKKGMEPNIAAIFAMPEKVIKRKIELAIDQKIIPDYLDIDFQLYMLNYKINSYIAEEYKDLFIGKDNSNKTPVIPNILVADSVIAGVENNSTIKSIIVRKLIEYAYNNQELDDAFYTALYDNTDLVNTAFINLIPAEKLKLFFDYRELCYGNNLFVNKFVSSGTLLPLDALLKLSRTEIEAKIDATVLSSSYLPDNVKGLVLIDTTESMESAKMAYAFYIYNAIQKQYATRAFLLKLATIPDTTITVFDETENSYLFDTFKLTLVDGCGNDLHFLDTTANGESFNIEKDVIRDYVEQLTKENSLFVSATLVIEGFTIDDFIRIFSAIQRLYSLTKDNAFETVVELLKGEKCSAYDIVKVGRYKFFQQFSQEISSVSYVYNAAENKVNKVMALLNKYSQSSNTLLPSVVSDQTPTAEEGDN
ncbi:MAG: hypothetical protein PHW19_12290, partial [Salinivirgaceae bacterium]|nr:hypothetical protein [Salinivirgaceae bacterium]